MKKLTKRQQAHEQLKNVLIKKRVSAYDRYIIYSEVEPHLNINSINDLIGWIELIDSNESFYLCFRRDYYGKVCSWFLEKELKNIRVKTYIFIDKEVK